MKNSSENFPRIIRRFKFARKKGNTFNIFLNRYMAERVRSYERDQKNLALRICEP